MTDLELKQLKDNLWHSADVLRAGAHLAANKYGQPILGLIFLRYADILFKQHKEEIAPTKQGFPCCIISRETNEKRLVQKGLKDYEIKYEFKMVMYSKRPELDTLLNQGWQIRKWFESLEIFTVADLEMGRDTPTW